MMKHRIFLGIILLGFSCSLFSQKEERKQLREGNGLYEKEKYTESEIAYRKALEVNNRSVKAAYNLGNSLYKQEKFKEAMEQYQVVTNAEKSKPTLAKTWHNIGNIMLNNKDYGKAVAAYKRSLVNNPADNETRYNLAVAQKMLSNQQQQNQDQNKDQDKDKKDDQKDQQQNKDKQDKQDKQDQQQQQQNQNIDKEKAQQILDALSEDEKKTQSKVKEEEAKARKERSKPEKDW